ncbi:hypothetical protein GCM10010172_80270 [Paractinoplanes ferrugineus]|uniref:Uncharacterized protein n=1 Tax=Paractinoplanes ferrugineus TaxID=113564 RepID=A0A919MID6_9ACTN|nr:hypothetical protein [Actinoplanes ferrugineus]GIE16743.1 hypothetical protein Afe05nite_85830 [Actinoplanes ferrugineus]
MDLYCWNHNKVHPFTPGEVEQIVYALTAEVWTAHQLGDPDGDYREYDPKWLICPREALAMGQDSECYLEQVEQGVACRRDG